MKLILLITTFLLSTNSIAQKVHKIYIAHSYNPDTYSWTGTIQKGIIQGFSKHGWKNGVHYKFIVNTLDSHIKNTNKEMVIEGKRIVEHIKFIKPDLVITTDDDALKYIGLKIKNIPVVFNGINAPISEYTKHPLINSQKTPGHNITGIYQTIYYNQTLKLLNQIDPKIKRFAVISDDTITGNSLLNYIKSQKSTLPLKWIDTFKSNKAQEWYTKLNEWKGKVDLIVTTTTSSILDHNARVIQSSDMFKLLVKKSSVPVSGNWKFQVQQGALASATDSGLQQGWFSADYAYSILNGKKPGNLPIITPTHGVPALNLLTLKKYKYKLSNQLKWMFFEKGVVIDESIAY